MAILGLQHYFSHRQAPVWAAMLGPVAISLMITACTPVLPQGPDTSAECDPSLASCIEVEERSQLLYVEEVPVARDDLMARVAELKRWLAWQRAVALGETDLPFESRDQLIDQAPEAMIEVELDAESRLSAIKQLSETGEIEQALLLAEALFSVEPDRAENITLYSALLTKNRQYDRSMALLDQAIAANPQVPEFYNNQAVNYAARGDLGRSIDLLQTAFSTHPSFAQIQFNLKQLYQATARRALSPLEEPVPPELNPIELHFELPTEPKLEVQTQDSEITEGELQ